MPNRIESLSVMVAAAVLMGATQGCSGESGSNAQPLPTTVEQIAAPADTGSGEPNLTAGIDGSLYLTWIEGSEGEHTLRFARWEGDAWSAATVVAGGDNWFVNWADFPELTVLENGTLAAHWLARTGESTYAYGIRMAFSSDGGKTWSDPVSPHIEDPSVYFGFVSLVPAGPEHVGVFWLDGRESGGGDHGHGEHGGGAMTLRYARVAADGTLDHEMLLDSRTCDCCPTDAVRLDDGSLVVVYRDRSEREIRDISAIRFSGGAWSEPISVHADNWKINGCPVNGPELDFDGLNGAVTWFTVDTEDKGYVRVAFSEDGGKSYAAPIRVDEGNPLGRVDLVLLEDGSALVVWLEDGTEGKAEVRLRRVTLDGTVDPSVRVAETQSSRRSGVPRLARLDSGAMVAWTDVEQGVKTARYR